MEKEKPFSQGGNVLTVSVDLGGKGGTSVSQAVGDWEEYLFLKEHNVQDQVSASQVAAWGCLTGRAGGKGDERQESVNGLQCAESHCHQGMEALSPALPSERLIGTQMNVREGRNSCQQVGSYLKITYCPASRALRELSRCRVSSCP